VLELPDIYFSKGERTPTHRIVTCKVVADDAQPPMCDCGSPMVLTGHIEQEAMDLPSLVAPTILHVVRQRYRCLNRICSDYVRPLTSIPPRGRMTQRLIDHIQMRSLVVPFVEVEAETGVSYSTIKRCFDASPSLVFRTDVQFVQMPAKQASGRSSPRASQTGIFLPSGPVSYSENDVNGTMQRFAGPSQRRQ
jgi:hypothetical protein